MLESKPKLSQQINLIIRDRCGDLYWTPVMQIDHLEYRIKFINPIIPSVNIDIIK